MPNTNLSVGTGRRGNPRGPPGPEVVSMTHLPGGKVEVRVPSDLRHRKKEQNMAKDEVKLNQEFIRLGRIRRLGRLGDFRDTIGQTRCLFGRVIAPK